MVINYAVIKDDFTFFFCSDAGSTSAFLNQRGSVALISNYVSSYVAGCCVYIYFPCLNCEALLSACQWSHSQAPSFRLKKNNITINVVYIARDVIILMRAISITRATAKGWALKSRLFWALKWQRAQRVPFGPTKVRQQNIFFHFCMLLNPRSGNEIMNPGSVMKNKSGSRIRQKQTRFL
jgi:hypothetical protein